MISARSEFKLDGRSPEAITASQRAFEVQVRDWLRVKEVLLPGELGKNKLSYS